MSALETIFALHLRKLFILLSSYIYSKDGRSFSCLKPESPQSGRMRQVMKKRYFALVAVALVTGLVMVPANAVAQEIALQDDDRIEMPLSDWTPSIRWHILGLGIAIDFDLGNWLFDFEEGIFIVSEIDPSFIISVYGMKLKFFELIISDLIVTIFPLTLLVYMDSFCLLTSQLLKSLEFSFSLLPFSIFASAAFTLQGLIPEVILVLFEEIIVKMLIKVLGWVFGVDLSSIPSELLLLIDIIVQSTFSIDGDGIALIIDPALLLGPLPLDVLPDYGFKYEWPW